MPRIGGVPYLCDLGRSGWSLATFSRSRRRSGLLVLAGKTMTFAALALGGLCAATAVDARWALAQEPVAREHDAAVALARRGSTDAALAILERLARQNPADLAIARDRIVISTWAGRDADAVALYEKLTTQEQPDYVVESAARAYRNLHRYAEALALYRASATRNPSNPGIAAGEIETLADAGDASAALVLAEKILKEHGDTAAVLIAAAYAAQAARSPVDALRFSDRALKRDPHNREARRQRVLAIESMGAPATALNLAQAEPGLLSADEIRRLEGSAAAQLVRWGPANPVDEAERFAATDRGIAALDELIARWSSEGDAARDPLLRARFDRLIALRDRGRMSDVVRGYETLTNTGVSVPNYALRSVASAYLALRQPETARDLYRRVLAADPGDVDSQLGLFNALVETEEFDEALRQVDATAARLASWTTLKGARDPISNPDKLSADVAVANAHFYADDLPEAEQRFTAMTDLAPNNATLLTGLARVDGARGWPRRAAEVLERARAQQPQDAEVEILQAGLDLEMREWRYFGGAVEDLARRLPENTAVQRLEIQSDIHNRAEMQLYADRAYRSSSNINGGNGIAAGLQIYSPPLSYDWRAFSGYRLAHERLPEGNITERVYDVGVEYRVRDFTAAAEGHFAQYGRNTGGGRVEGEWSRDDYWQIGGSGEKFSSDTPIRALFHGITADALNAHVVYRASESREVKLTSQAMLFSDGNTRTNLGADWRERMFTSPHFHINALGDLGLSHNTRPDAPYFNPRSAVLVAGGVELVQILYRRYELTYEHAVVGLAGPYWEQHFGTGLAWSAHYEQRIRGDALEAALGVGFARQPYDRVYENAVTLSFNLTWRF
jgi:biofilm PGA synthesis protein PgaA